MNLIILKGNLGQDPVIKSFEWGKTAQFSLATTEKFKNKKNEAITETDWHNIVFRGSVCDVIEKHLKKGDQIAVTGKIKYRSYEDKEGVTKYITEVRADRFEFCGNAKEKPRNSDMPEDVFTGNSELDDLPY